VVSEFLCKKSEKFASIYSRIRAVNFGHRKNAKNQTKIPPELGGNPIMTSFWT